MKKQLKDISDEVIYDLYIKQDLSSIKIAKLLGISTSSVCRRLKKMGITKPATGHEGRNGKRGVVTHKGYPVTYMPSHPRARSNGYVKTHILVMESIIGRHLTKSEVVHHINEKKDDNRPENLMLFANNSEHLKHHYETTNRAKNISEKNKRNSYITAKKQAVVQKGTDGELIAIYESLHEGSRQTNISVQQIWRCCNKKCKTANGFIFEYLKKG